MCGTDHFFCCGTEKRGHNIKVWSCDILWHPFFSLLLEKKCPPLVRMGVENVSLQIPWTCSPLASAVNQSNNGCATWVQKIAEVFYSLPAKSAAGTHSICHLTCWPDEPQNYPKNFNFANDALIAQESANQIESIPLAVRLPKWDVEERTTCKIECSKNM